MKKNFLKLACLATMWLTGASAWALSQVDGVYQIGSAEDLVAFAALEDVATANAVLTADIDMAGQEWAGISDYSGTFDGQEKTISNLGGPLFSTTVSGVTIKNLTLTGEITVDSGNDVGAFIGYHNGAKINLENCINKTDITAEASNYVGGLIGRANISSNNSNNAVLNCLNEGAISGKDYTAGLIGAQTWSDGGTECLHITGSANKGEVTGQAYTAGLLGQNNCRIYYTDSWNTGKVTGTASVGGLLGQSKRGWQYFTRCYNTGDVTGEKYVSGMMADYNRGNLSYTNFEDCFNTGTVRGTGDNVGGFVGRAYVSTSSPFVFKNCYNTGDIYGPAAYRPRVLVMWTNTTDMTVENCWNIGEIKDIETGEPFTGSNVATLVNAGTPVNSYDLANESQAPKYGKPEGYTDEWLSSGQFTYFINGESSETPTWYQNLPGDAYPVLDNTHGVVYQTSDKNCDGTPKAEVTFANTPGGNRDPHTFTEGFCTVCDAADPDYLTPNGDGFYEISDANKLRWFAVLVNDGTNSGANAKITKAIDLTEKTQYPIGTKTNPYTGTFDGQLYPLTGVSSMMFGSIKGATISGIAIESGAITVADKTYANHAGSIVGEALSGKASTLTKSYSKVNVTETASMDLGGVAGKFFGTISNCFYTGALAGKSTIGGLVGSSSEKNVALEMSNSFCIVSSFSKSADCLAGWLHNTSKMTNCFAIAGAGTMAGGTTGMGTAANYVTKTNVVNSGFKTAEEFASGEIAYKLNQGAGEFVFFQTIGTDEYPKFEGYYVAGIGEAGVGTFSVATEAIAIPQGITAYKGKIEGDMLKLTALEGNIPAGAAFVIEGETGYYNFAPAASAAAIADNDLLGTAQPKEATGSEYALAIATDNKPAFLKVAAGTVIPFAKAYLNIPEGGDVKSIRMSFGETGINAVQSSESTVQSIYDLQGRRVEKATKGIYIVNGKKVLK